jgi:hypothetical protein
MKENWKGLIKILEIQHLDKNGNIIWKDNNLTNILHHEGELVILSSMFTDGVVPPIYYFGLDQRYELSLNDNLSTIYNEPNTSGYARVAVSSVGQFSLITTSGVSTAYSPVISFAAVGGSFSASNLFMATSADSSGQLIASVPLNNFITVQSGEQISMKMSLTLRAQCDCPPGIPLTLSNAPNTSGTVVLNNAPNNTTSFIENNLSSSRKSIVSINKKQLVVTNNRQSFAVANNTTTFTAPSTATSVTCTVPTTLIPGLLKIVINEDALYNEWYGKGRCQSNPNGGTTTNRYDTHFILKIIKVTDPPITYIDHYQGGTWRFPGDKQSPAGSLVTFLTPPFTHEGGGIGYEYELQAPPWYYFPATSTGGGFAPCPNGINWKKQYNTFNSTLGFGDNSFTILAGNYYAYLATCQWNTQYNPVTPLYKITIQSGISFTLYPKTSDLDPTMPYPQAKCT